MQWPKYRDKANLSRAVTKCIEPDSNLQCFRIRRLHSHSKFSFESL